MNNTVKTQMNTQIKSSWSVCAIVSFAAGLAGILFGGLFSLLAIILGHVALSNINKASTVKNHLRIETPKGRKMAIAGLILGYSNGLWLFFINNVYDKEPRKIFVTLGFIIFILAVLGWGQKKRKN
jgi:hypothetical protein